MIEFRCWSCNKRYDILEKRIGERFTCTCGRLLRVPSQSGGNCRVKTLVDWVVETILYGGGGAVLGFGLAWLWIASWQGSWDFDRSPSGVFFFVATLTVVGFVVGLFGGERGIDWLVGLIRDIEKR